MHDNLKRIKDGNFHLVAGIWSDNGWAVHIFIVVDGGKPLSRNIFLMMLS